jgi:hypothetical protein
MKYIGFILVFILLKTKSVGQQIAIDQGIKAGSIWCFPLVSDSLAYYYLPSSAKMVTNEIGHPKFSLLRYVSIKKYETDKPISEAEGGAILNFLVEYETTQKSLKSAESKLVELKGKNAKLRGPIIFKKARYALVSSVLGGEKYKVLSTGDAPILEGSGLAFSFQMSPKDSQLLLESFKTGTSDVSIVFDFTFEGFTDAFNAKLEVDWAKTHEISEKNATLKIYTLGLEAKENIDNLIKNEAIKLTTIGQNNHMEALLDKAYSKILDLLYEPIDPEKAMQQSPINTNTIFDDFFINLKKEIETILPISFNAAYKRKIIKKEGRFNYVFNARNTTERHHFVSFNLGDIYTKYGNNQLIFKDIALFDRSFQQRQIAIGIDGEMERDFSKILNNVTIIFKKIHQDSTITIKEIVLNKDSFKANTAPTIDYLCQNDSDQLNWLKYEYQTIWQIKGGGKITSNWVQDSSPMINLYLPYKTREISFEGDLTALIQQKIIQISIEINYLLAATKRSEFIKIKPTENLESKSIKISIPNETEMIDYTITWHKADGSVISKKGKDQYGLIIIDKY